MQEDMFSAYLITSYHRLWVQPKALGLVIRQSNLANLPSSANTKILHWTALVLLSASFSTALTDQLANEQTEEIKPRPANSVSLGQDTVPARAHSYMASRPQPVAPRATASVRRAPPPRLRGSTRTAGAVSRACRCAQNLPPLPLPFIMLGAMLGCA